MNPNDAKVWITYAETDLRAAHTLLDSGEFSPARFVENEARETLKLAEAVLHSISREMQVRHQKAF